jgi:hypothetical protein
VSEVANESRDHSSTLMKAADNMNEVTKMVVEIRTFLDKLGWIQD